MKLIFSFCLVQPTFGNELIIISYQKDSSLVSSLEKILIHDFFIPLSLIKKIKTEFECEIIENTVLHLCLTNEGEMKFVNLEVKKVQEVLGVFYEK